jgi:hypothetical protein
MLINGNRLRPDGSPVWPLRHEDLPSLTTTGAAEQRKQVAIMERRVLASRGVA